MNIETKFEINDEVWFINSAQKAFSSKITEISIRVLSQPIYKTGERRDLLKTGDYKNKGKQVYYTLDNPSYAPTSNKSITKSEHELFKTKEELLKSL